QCSRLQEVPASVLDLEQLEDVICDDDTKVLMEPFLSAMGNIVRVLYDDYNLDWLHSSPT
uniref:hypothetical protein n=1 Tax=Staphylococcus aureus TaxID=1280 RepID=UPI0038B23222